MIFTEDYKTECECKPKRDKVVEGLITDIGLVDTALKEHEVEADAKFAQTNTSVDTKDAVIKSSVEQLRDDMDGQDSAILSKIENIQNTLASMQSLYTDISILSNRISSTDSDVEDVVGLFNDLNNKVLETLIKFETLKQQVNTVAGQLNNLNAESVITDTLNADTATIGEGTFTKVNATNASIGNVNANSIEAGNVSFGNVTATEIGSNNVNTDTLSANKIESNEVEVNNIKIKGNMELENFNVTNVNAVNERVTNSYVENFNAEEARIKTLFGLVEII